MENKIICKNCEIEKEERKYFLSRWCIEKYMPICKSCFIEEIYKCNDLFDVFKKYNIPFIYNLWNVIKSNGDTKIYEYMDRINLPQYKNLTWKDSVLEEDKESKEVNFYDDIVNNLKQEAKHLNNRLTRFRDNNEMQSYIATLKSLRETLDLIKKYDWNLMYSEYGVENINNQLVTEIAVWEQNHDGQIRNHKVWRTDVEYKKYKYIVDNEIRP